MASQNDQDLQFWDNPNSPNYNLVNQGQPRTLLERAMPILVVILTILVAILLPLAISNHVKVSNNEGINTTFYIFVLPIGSNHKFRNYKPEFSQLLNKFSKSCIFICYFFHPKQSDWL